MMLIKNLMECYPSMYAAKFNRVDIIKLLITGGSEIHATCDKGYDSLESMQKNQTLKMRLSLS